MSFPRHKEIYQFDDLFSSMTIVLRDALVREARRGGHTPLIVLMSFRLVIPWRLLSRRARLRFTSLEHFAAKRRGRQSECHRGAVVGRKEMEDGLLTVMNKVATQELSRRLPNELVRQRLDRTGAQR